MSVFSSKVTMNMRWNGYEHLGAMGWRSLRTGLTLCVLLFGWSCRDTGESWRPGDDIRRTGLARFSGAQAYEPCRWPEPGHDRLLSPPRCGPEPGVEDARRHLVGARGAAAADPPAGADFHSRGLRRVVAAVEADLLVRGIQDLKRARVPELGRDDTDIENDLVAAFLKLAGMTDDSYSLFFAADRVLAQLERAPRHPELLYNRALVWDLMGVVDEAVLSWEKLLETDRDSPWAADAGGRLAELRRQSSNPSAVPTPADLSVARRRVVLELLPEWAEAIRGGDPDAAGTILREAEDVARGSADQLALDTIETLMKAAADPLGARTESLARAHELLARGMAHGRRFETREAIRSLTAAREDLARVDSPAVLLVDFHQGMAHYHVERYVQARALLADVRDAAAGRDEPFLRGLSLKGLALIEQATGHPEVAANLYRQALDEVERSGDLREQIMLSSILADGLLAAGRDKEAWQLLHRSVRGAWRQSEAEPRYVVSAAVAAMAEKRGFLHLAAVMNRLSLQASYEIASPATIADSATWYAKSLAELGRLDEASAALTDVRTALSEVEDEAAWRRARADLDCVEGRRRLASGDATAALPLLRDAADYYESASLLTHAAPCRAAEGSALLALGDPDAATETLARSITLMRRLDGFLPRPEAYFGTVDPTLELLESVLALHLDRGEPRPALQLADVALRRAFPLAPRSGSERDDDMLENADLQDTARADQVVLVVYPLPDRVVTWRLNGGRLTTHEASVDRGRMIEQVLRFTEAVRRGDDAWREERRQLGALLLGDLLQDVPIGRQLIVVPSAELAVLPWGLLEAPGRGRLLLEERPVALAADVRAARRASQERSRSTAASLLVVANPSIEADYEHPALPYAEEEAAAILELYPSASHLLAGEGATKARVLEQLAGHSAVHLAVHGVSDAHRPDASYLLLRGDDGHADPWTVREIRGLDLRGIDLVVLAACDSSFRGTALATHALGLGEALLSAGVRAVVASGWAVDDRATRRLMTRFYAALASGEEVGEALRVAQMNELAQAPSDGPGDVGAFRVLGDPTVTLHLPNQEE